MSSLLLLSLIGCIGFASQWLSHKVKLPAILFLLISGILLGPVFGLLDPDKVFGDLLFPFISLSVAVILFEGALTLKRHELGGIGVPVRRMVTTGVLVNAVIMTVATHYLLQVSWEISALFAALMVVTGPTVIMPMLKTVRPLPKIADALRWEGIIVDCIGALLAVLVFEWIIVQQQAAEFADIFLVFGFTILTGALIGAVVGYGFGLLLRNHWIPEFLENFASLAVVCLAFSLSDHFAHESGLLAVTVMGILLTNMKDVHVRPILEFKEDLTIVFVSVLFIVLAARLDINALLDLGWIALVLVAVMQFIARPAKVFLSFIGSDFHWREKALVAWIGPRGIVAAAVSAVFALKLEELGIEGADKLVPLAFLIIIGTVVFQSLTARPIAKLLKVAQAEKPGVAIIGANEVSIELAKLLERENVNVIICDTNWDNLAEARIAGLATYYGNPSSEHASMHLSLAPYQTMLGLSNHFEFNVTQASNLKEHFGRINVFVLAPNQSSERYQRHLASTKNNGRILFGNEFSYGKLRRLLRQGAQFKATRLSNEYTYSQWREANPQALCLLTIDDHDLSFAVADSTFEPENSCTVISLIPNESH